MKEVKVCILRTAGTNCDKETAFAFLKAGGKPELVHINKLISREDKLDNYHILAIAGGFSYGDDLGAGKILANELRLKLIDDITKFISQGKLIIGICNGFQVLVKSGLLPGNNNLEQEASLIINDSGKFEDRWVYLKKSGIFLSAQDILSKGSKQIRNAGNQNFEGRESRIKNRESSKCVWTQGLPEVIYLPVAHGEGKFITRDKSVLEKLRANGQIVFQYCDQAGNLLGYPYNPNGSEDNIAGICDESGRILGLMPHPERHIDILQHPRGLEILNKNAGDGLQIFTSGIEYAKKYLSAFA